MDWKGSTERGLWVLEMSYILNLLHRHMHILKFIELYILNIYAFYCVHVIPRHRLKIPKSMKTVTNIPRHSNC